jgi:hypothetical protein
MFKILEKVLGVIATNKLRILCGETKRNPFAAIATEFVKGYSKVFTQGGDMMKFYLIIAPFFNLFMFSGFFAFLFIMGSNFYIFRLAFSK